MNNAAKTITARLYDLNKVLVSRIVAEDFPANVFVSYVRNVQNALSIVADMPVAERLAWIERAESHAKTVDLVKALGYSEGLHEYLRPRVIA